MFNKEKYLENKKNKIINKYNATIEKYNMLGKEFNSSILKSWFLHYYIEDGVEKNFGVWRDTLENYEKMKKNEFKMRRQARKAAKKVHRMWKWYSEFLSKPKLLKFNWYRDAVQQKMEKAYFNCPLAKKNIKREKFDNDFDKVWAKIEKEMLKKEAK